MSAQLRDPARWIFISLTLALTPFANSADATPALGDLDPEARASEVMATLEQPRSHANVLRSSAETARIAPTLDLLLGADSLQTTVTPDGATVRPRLPGAALQAPLSGPLRDLLAVVLKAAGTVDQATAALPLERRRDLLVPPSEITPWVARDVSGSGIASLTSARSALERERRSVYGAMARVKREVDLAAIFGASREVAAAIDRQLPVLRRATTPLTVSASSSPCDVLDLQGVLCVGGAGASEYKDSYLVLLDLGGDDVYTGPVGVGSINEGVSKYPVSVAIDLGGNDRYGSPSVQVTSGVGEFGIGMLVDASGDDTYLAGDADPRPDLDLEALAQGYGAGGVGVLSDLAGDDTYRMSAAAAFPSGMEGQAYGLYGVGMLLDQGDGIDEYSMTSAIPPGEPSDGVFVHGQSGAYAGASLLYDGGGDGNFDLHTEGGDVGEVVGQARGVQGDAFLLGGEGDTSYTMSADTSGSYRVWGQGYLVLGGTALLDDRGGDDSYSIRGTSSRSVSVVADEACGCENAVATNESKGEGSIFGQAELNAYSGFALVHDHAGSDRYSILSATFREATAENRLLSSAKGATATAVGATTVALGQGASLVSQAGVLQDDAGDDEYSMQINAKTVATARSAAPGTPELAIAEGGDPGGGLKGQGWGPGGAVLDLGGSDTFSVQVREWAIADPTQELARDPLARVESQGAFLGGLLFDQGGSSEEDTYVREPNLGAAVGSFGEGHGTMWLEPWPAPQDYLNGMADSYAYPGAGYSGGAAAKQSAHLAFAPSTPSTVVSGRNAFSVRLTDSNGDPVAGAPILFELEHVVPCSEPCGLYQAVLRTHGSTDESGVAIAIFDASTLPSGTYSLLANFSGTGGLRFSVADQPLTRS